MRPQDAPFDLIVIASSQGGVRVLRTVLADLPTEFPAPIVAVQHRAERPADGLATILGAASPLAVEPARDGTMVRPGVVHVAPPRGQVTVGDGGVLEIDAPRDRCLADPLFGSAARYAGSRVIALVLSGRLSDGALGARVVKAAGGRVLVQDPATAEQSSMPTAAAATGCADLLLAPEAIATALRALVSVPGAGLLNVASPSRRATRAV